MTSRIAMRMAAWRRALLSAGALIVLASTASAAGTDDLNLTSLSGTYLSARSADQQKDIGRAAAFYRAAHAADPDNLFLLERALLLTAADGEIDEALRFARTLTGRDPGNRIAHLLLAMEDLRQRDFAGAISAMEKTGDGVLLDLTRALVTAWALVGRNETDEALRTIDELDGQSWYEPFKLMHGGAIAAAAGRNEEALRRFRQAYELDRNAIRITEAYARALARAGRRSEAEDVLLDYLARFPDNPLAVQVLEEVRSGGPVEALVRTPSEGVAEALSGLGAAIGQEGGLELALLYLQLALYLEPQIAGGLATLSLGNILDTNGQSEAAIEVFRDVTPDSPFGAAAQLRAAMALDRLDQPEAAEAAFRESISRDPDDLQTYITYGNVLRGRERFAEAADVYTQAIERIEEPTREDWPVFYFRGIAHERTKQWPKAEADFTRALDLHPDQPLVLNYLGYSWVDMGYRLNEALDMIRKAVELRPNDGFIVDSLGWAYYRLGRFDEAVTELEQAVALEPSDPVINDHLGDAYWKVGRELEAQFQWRHARDLGAKDPERALILKKIAEKRLIEKELTPAAEEAAPAEQDAAAPTEGGATTAAVDPREAAAEAEKVYTVQPGESLRDIAVKIFGDGDAYTRLLEANRDILGGAEAVKPGMRLKIPRDL